MTLTELLAELNEREVTVSLKGDDLVVRGEEQRLDDPALRASLRANKEALVDWLRSGAQAGRRDPTQAGENRIPSGCEHITPDMLTLVSLGELDIARIVATVPGGAANVQDIYPLTPLQEGILFHHLTTRDGDPYLLHSLYAFDTRSRLDEFLRATQAVIDRHDVLRTAVLWEDLPEPVQVVWRRAPLAIEALEFDPAAGDIGAQLNAHFDPRRYRIDVRQAPMLRVGIAHDPRHSRWLMLLLNHHLMGDHSTLDIMRREIQDHLLGRAAHLPAPLPFRSFVAQTRHGTTRDEQEAFFREMLADVSEPTAPFGLTDVQGDGLSIAEVWRELDAGLAARLREQARMNGVSAASLFHLAWGQVLARISSPDTDDDSVVFGTVLSGRMQGGADGERMLGMFINTLPIRIRIDDTGVRDSVRQTHALLAKLLQHEHASLALAQRCSAVEAPAPLFVAFLNYRHSASAARLPADARQAWEGVEVLGGVDRTNYPCNLNVDDFGDTFALHAQVQAPLDPARICAYMQAALEQLVEALQHAPSTPVRSLDILPAPERHQLVVGWNATRTAPVRTCVHTLFEHEAASHPEAVAIVDGERRLSYGELNEQANRLAHHLLSLGVQPGARLALAMPRSAEMIVGMLAVLKAGAGYVPLDPTYPAARVAWMIGHCRPEAILTLQGVPDAIRDAFEKAGAPVLDLRAESMRWEGAPSTNPVLAQGEPGPKDLAYVIYTSGSTGEPKGVMVEHGGLTNHTVWQARTFGFTRADAVLQRTSMAFDASVWEVWTPLAIGARVVLLPAGADKDPAAIARIVEQERVTVAQFVPSLLRELVQPDQRFTCDTIFCGGEPLDVALATAARERARRALVNVYGPTETTIQTIAWRHPDDASPACVPIGRPIDNVRVYLLDGLRRPVPIGAAGEIAIAGPAVARGYLDQPNLSAERFVADPFAAEFGEGTDARMFLTGDVGRYLEDGNIVFVGRNDFQVKVRGFRIELGEIEARLIQHPGIREAVVLAREDGPGDMRLVAYYTVRDEGGQEGVTPDGLREYLSTMLAEYMLPVAFVALDAMPLTPNGKVDRKALPAPEAIADGAASHYVAPANEAEAALARIWAEVLQIERVGRHDHFFELGGHSLLAVKVASRVRKAMGVEIGVGELFSHPVLASFACAVEEAAGGALPPITTVPRDQPLALSFAQQRLWFLSQIEGAGAAYHMGMGLRFDGVLDTGALRGALDRIVARHEALRTTFALVDGVPVQRIAPPDCGMALKWHDLQGRMDAVQALRQLTEEEAREPFDLRTGPLTRGRLICLAPHTHVLLVTMHHIVSDGWSTGVLSREFASLYRAFNENREDPLPPLAIQYADYAVWQRRWLSGETLRAQTEFWSSTLAGAPERLDLPLDRQRPARQDYAGARVEIVLDAALVRALKGLSQRHGTTLFMTLLTAWAVLLARLSGQTDIVVGTPTANRARAEIEPLIGCFVNTLALRLDLSASPTVVQLMQQVKTRTLAAQAHQDLPFEHVVEIVNPSRSLAHSPVCQVMFAWQNTETPALALPGLSCVALESAAVTAKFDLTLNLGEVGECVIGELEYATALFERGTALRYRDYLRQLLEAMVADDRQPVDRLKLLSAGERARLLSSRQGMRREEPQDKTLAQLFEAQARKTPEAVAVVSADERLTYCELNERANQLAHWLREVGAGPDARVALCAERGAQLMVGLLAIAKAGAAYVPMDPAYPAQRLAWMLDDSAPLAVVTQQAVSPATTLPVFRLDSDWHTLVDAPRGDAVSQAQAHHLAYVVYTSGSTGRPKGVAVEHRSVVNLLSAMASEPGLSADDVLLAVTSPSFDIAGLEWWLPLIVGARVICASRADVNDPARLTQLAREHAVTVMQATPSLWRAMLREDWSGFGARLRVLCGGEALPADLAEGLLARAASVWNLYGPTETTIWSTVQEVKSARRAPPIGRPIANTQVYVVDVHGEPVPDGVAGELMIGGAGVARGYLNRQELTAQSFVRDPFGAEPEGRLYRTGDLVRYDADGRLEYLGRNDFQIKLRGFRIEPGEIEQRLRQHPAVAECAVVRREDTPGDQRLAAYLVPRSTDDIDSRQTDGGGQGQVAFSLFHFGADTGAPVAEAGGKYRLLLESTRFADAHGFTAVWTPERHFHEVGGLYPNPAVLAAALATITQRVELRAGSVVLPLHHPLRVAEEWSVVDNLSHGRVGVSIASGWHPADFALAPDRYAERKAVMADGIRMLRALWRGETATFTDGAGKPADVRIFPQPVQPELPLWVTAGGNPDTFVQAGSLGANVLTHLLGQTIDEAAANIARYREARASHGFDPEAGKVSLMVHTFVGTDLDETLARAKAPFMRYMRAHVGLMEAFARSLDMQAGELSESRIEQIVTFAFERYTRSASLIGTPQTCMEVVDRLREIGVDEIACLIDWMEPQLALDGLPPLAALQRLARGARPGGRALRAHLRASLPEYMMPASFTFLDALPLTPGGKLDRAALPVPVGQVAERAYEAPIGEAETRIAGIWADVLRVERVGRHDDFFELGGHSLLAVGLVERMREAGLPTDVRALFEAPTVAQLAVEVGRHAQDRIDVPPNGIPPGCTALTPAMLPLVRLDEAALGRIVATVDGGAANVQDIYPLAPLQEGILFHHLVERDGDPYAQHMMYRFDTRERAERYIEALQAVIDRHDILRTAVLWEGLPEPVQVVWRRAPLAVEEVEVDPARDPAAQLRERFDPRRYRLDIVRAPIMRVMIARDARSGSWVLMRWEHQLVVEHTSQEAVQREIGMHLSGHSAHLPAPPPFRDFVAQARLGVSREAHEAFYRDLLGDVNEPTAPFGLADVHGDGSRIAQARHALDAQLAARMRAAARAAGVSAASLCHLAWAQVLSKLVGRDDVVFGTVMFGRMQGGEGADRALGMFINTLAVRLRVGDVTVREGLRETHARLARLLRHEHAPLALAQRASRVAAPAPLFTTLLNYRHSPVEASDDAPRVWEGVELLEGDERTNYPLTLSVEDLGEAFALTAQVRQPVAAERICEYMVLALERIVDALEHTPETPMHVLGILPEAERQRLLVDWNATQVDYPAHEGIHTLFEAQAARTPQAIAVSDDDRVLRYAELDAEAARLAAHLQMLGVQPGDRVAVGLERCSALVVAQLAVLKCGAAYVMLDPAAPAARQAFVIGDSAARVVLSLTGLDLPGCPGVERVNLDVLDARGAASVDLADTVRVAGDTSAAVVYTSGSTGEPKGVIVPHRAIARLVINGGYVRFQADDRVAFTANPAFDTSSFEVWGPLVHGAAIVVINQAVLLAPDVLRERLSEAGVTILHLTAGLLAAYADALAPIFPSLRYLMTGGDVVDPRALANVLRDNAPQRLIHCYGPTETATFATTFDVTRVPDGAIRVPIGRPIGNTRIYLLDARGEPVPVGAEGEICIGGPGVALGYLNQPALSAERFVADPFAHLFGDEPTARLYKTGDLGRQDADGVLEFLGRHDAQVKIRGFRVELGEIEACLAAHASVREAVVLMRESSDAGGGLVAYCTARPGAVIDAAALRAHVAERVPNYMVPIAYVALDSLPLTANGKLDRRALPEPGAHAYVRRSFEAPEGATEIALARLWADLLECERIGRHDHFFELGGHSLLAVRLIERMREEGLHADVRALFASPTLAGLATVTEKRWKL